MKNKIDIREKTLEEAINMINEKVEASAIDSIEVLLSNDAIVQKVVEHLTNKGAVIEEQMSQSGQQTIVASFSQPTNLKSYVVDRDALGHGNRDIGTKLMTAYFNVSAEYPIAASKIFFLNTGVNLVLEDSACVAAIKLLESKGVDIIVCGTCLDFFNIREKLAVGRIGTMHDLLALHRGSEEVISV